jgi:predicted acyl esterase
MKLLFAVVLCVLSGATLAAQDKVSEPGRYVGYGDARYSGWARTSIYVPARDGTRLAVDIFRPKQDGQVESRALPVLLSITQYRRAAKAKDGSVRYGAADMLELVKFGYVVIVADARGKGASFGTRRGPWSDDEARDAADLIQWAAKQSWSTGKVGMFGASYLGGIQLAAVREKPAALKAVMADLIVFDVFDAFMGMVPPEGPLFDGFDEVVDAATVPVDEDVDGKLLKAAIEEHRANKVVGPLPYRDSVSKTLGVDFYSEVNPSAHLREIGEWGGGIYLLGHWGNWLSSGATSGFANFKNPTKLTLLKGLGFSGAGPARPGSFDVVTEHRRWFDHWLKGVDNGIMREPAVFYEIANTAERRQAAIWHRDTAREQWYLAHGQLTPQAPSSGTASFTVKYHITREARTVSGLTFDSPLVTKAFSIAGFIQADFSVATSGADGDFIAYVQDVAPNGAIREITEGRIRASQRIEHEPPFDTFGMPWHRAHREDIKPMTPDAIERVRFAFLPIAWTMQQGHRLRLVVTGAMPQRSPGLDMMNATPRQTPAPRQTIALGPSRLILPIER